MGAEGNSYSCDETVLKTDNVNSCTTMWIYLMPLNCISKRIRMVKILLWIFYYNKKQTKNNKKDLRSNWRFGENMCPHACNDNFVIKYNFKPTIKFSPNIILKLSNLPRIWQNCWMNTCIPSPKSTYC